MESIKIVKTFLMDHYAIPDGYVDKTTFKAQSYSAYAFEELIRYIRKHRHSNIMWATEQFRHKLDAFACSTESEEANFMFSCMYDAMTDFLDWLVVEMENLYERF